MSRGTTRRSAFGRRTRTVPNSSRSVTNASPSGPPTNPPLRLRPTSAIAPGGGGSSIRSTTATGWPASLEDLGEPRRLVRGEHDPAALLPPAARPRRRGGAARPSGSTGSRQPNRSPELLPPDAIATPAGGSDSHVSSSVRDADEPALPVPRREVGRWPVLGQLAGLDQLGPALVGLAPQERGGLGDVAGLVEHEERARIDVIEAGRGRELGGPDLGRVADGHRPGCAGRGRAAAGRRPSLRSGRGRRPAARRGATPPGRAARGSRPRPRSGAGTPTRAGGRSARPRRSSAGRSGRTPAASRSRRRRTRSGSGAPSMAGRRRRCRRAARTRHARRPR